jgi:hypothetical protein
MMPTAARYFAILRYQPTTLSESLSAPALQYVYLDSTSSNGYYPDPQTFLNDFNKANPDVLSGNCSKIAKLSDTVVTQAVAGGSAAPTVVIGAYPLSVGTCTENLNLGQGTATLSISVDP